MKLKVIRKTKRKKKVAVPKPKPGMLRLEHPYVVATRNLLKLGKTLEEIEKDLKLKEPGSRIYFFHFHNLKDILYRVKINAVSLKDFNRWLNLLKPRFNKDIFFLRYDSKQSLDSLKQLYRWQKENKLTRKAVVNMLEGFPLEIEQMIYLGNGPEMALVGKKKNPVKVKSIRRKK